MNLKSEWKEKNYFYSITVPDESWNKNYPVLNDRQGLSKIRWNFLTVDLNQTAFLFFLFREPSQELRSVDCICKIKQCIIH